MKKLILISLFISQIMSAQETQQIKEVQINGRKKVQKERAEFKRHGQSTEALTKDELERNNSAFVEQALGTMAGVQVDKRTMLGGQRIVIRGYGNDQKFNNWGIKVYLDGMPITTADGVTNLDDIDYTTINNMEVIKGPAATMYGGGVGGVVRFYTKTSEDTGVSLEQKTIGGSYGLFQSNSKLDIVNSKSSTSVNFSHLQSDGYRPHGASLKNYFTIYSKIKLTENQSLSIYGAHNFSHDEVSGQISYADYYAGVDNGNSAYIKKNAKNDFFSDRVGLNYTVKMKNNISLSTIGFFSNVNQKSISAGADGNTLMQNYGIRSILGWNANLDKNWKYDLNIGTEIQQTQSLTSSFRFTGTVDPIPLQVQSINNGSFFKFFNNQYSFFTTNRFTFKPLDLTFIVGLSANTIAYNRSDLLSAPGLLTGYNKDLSLNKSFDFVFNPHIAIQKTYKNQIFNLSYSEGYNAPTSGNTFISGINKVNDSLQPERARMIDFSIQGLLDGTRLDYQISIFSIMVRNKLTTLSGKDPVSGTAYNYTANTGNQINTGFEGSLGYNFGSEKTAGFSKIEPFVSYSYYNFKYDDFATKLGSATTNYKDKMVVGVPQNKITLGFDLKHKSGFYMNNTFNYLGSVFTDFANTNEVSGYHQFNSKVGLKKSFADGKIAFDAFVAGNNLSSQANYTFLFLGNSINDADPGNGYPAGVATDINPGPSKAYFWGGLSLKYKF